MAGGLLVFGGKWIAAEDFEAAGLAGRQLGALGSSVVQNASLGRSRLQEVWSPVGPLWLQIRPGSGLRARLNLWETAVLMWAVSRDEFRLDWKRSALNGAFVFDAPARSLRDDGRHVLGLAAGGTVVLERGDDASQASVLRHEMVHVLQQDYWFQTMGRPVEAWGWSRLEGRPLPIDIGLVSPLVTALLFKGLHEREAEMLAPR